MEHKSKVRFAQLHGLNHPYAQEVGLGILGIHKSHATKFLLHATLILANPHAGKLFMSLPEVVTDCTPQLCENHVGAPPPTYL